MCYIVTSEIFTARGPIITVTVHYFWHVINQELSIMKNQVYPINFLSKLFVRINLQTKLTLVPQQLRHKFILFPL